MMNTKSIFGAVLLGSLLVLGGCGGSDSDDSSGDTSNTGDTNNTGGSNANIKTTAATIESSNAQDLGVAAARGIKKAVFDNLAQDGLPNIGGISFPTGIDVSDQFNGICESGSVSADVSVNGSYTIVYNNCSYEGTTINGTFKSTVSSDGDTVIIQQTGFSVTSNGQTNTIEDSTITCTGYTTGNYSCTSTAGWSVSGDAYQLSDATVEDTGNGYEVTVTVADTEHGSIDVETTIAVTFDCPNQEPGAGAATFTGANGTSGQVNFVSCTSFTVTVDGVAETYSWEDIEI